jgi:hypothetical protein
MSINQRVETLIKKTTLSKTAFSKATGISTVILSHISSGRNKVSLSTVEQILIAYPKINAEWLLLGKGQIFKDSLDTELTEMVEFQLTQLSDEMERFQKSATHKINLLRASLAELK